MNKQLIIIIVIAAVAIAGIVAIAKFIGNEDTWVCQNGQWVKQGNPSAPMPTEPCATPSASASPTPTPSAQAEIEVYTPLPNQTIKSPLTVSGKALGNWFFEASFPMKIVDSQGNQLGISHVQAIGDWMSPGFVNFSGELSFSATATTTGFLVLENDNPSGLPQNAKEIKIPVTISTAKATKVKAFFNNNLLDPEISCSKVFSVWREIAPTSAVARASLEELLTGPSEIEKKLGFITSINSGVKINSLTIQSGIAKVDFNEQLQFQVGGSCRVAAIRAQITETLKQFSTVQSVVISIDGKTEDILQP